MTGQFLTRSGQKGSSSVYECIYWHLSIKLESVLLALPKSTSFFGKLGGTRPADKVRLSRSSFESESKTEILLRCSSTREQIVIWLSCNWVGSLGAAGCGSWILWFSSGIAAFLYVTQYDGGNIVFIINDRAISHKIWAERVFICVRVYLLTFVH